MLSLSDFALQVHRHHLGSVSLKKNGGPPCSRCKTSLDTLFAISAADGQREFVRRRIAASIHEAIGRRGMQYDDEIKSFRGM